MTTVVSDTLTFANKIAVLHALMVGTTPDIIAESFQTTVNRVMEIDNSFHDIREVSFLINQSKHLKLKGGLFPRMENVLFAWYSSQNRSVPNKELAEKAKKIISILNEKPTQKNSAPFTGSNYWVNAFKSRYNIPSTRRVKPTLASNEPEQPERADDFVLRIENVFSLAGEDLADAQIKENECDSDGDHTLRIEFKAEPEEVQANNWDFRLESDFSIADDTQDDEVRVSGEVDQNVRASDATDRTAQVSDEHDRNAHVSDKANWEDDPIDNNSPAVALTDFTIQNVRVSDEADQNVHACDETDQNSHVSDEADRNSQDDPIENNSPAVALTMQDVDDDWAEQLKSKKRKRPTIIADDYSSSEESLDPEPSKARKKIKFSEREKVLVPSRKNGVKSMYLQDYKEDKVIRIFKPVLKYAKDTGWSQEDSDNLNRLYNKSLSSCKGKAKQTTITTFYKVKKRRP